MSYYCQFSFQMMVATPAGAVTETVNDNGKPFQITGTPIDPHSQTPFSKYAYVYIGGIDATLIPSLHDRKGAFVRVNPKIFKE